MSDLQGLKLHMQLKSIEADSLTFAEFVALLPQKPEIADTAPALIVRAIKSRGVVDIDKEIPERQGYLRLLQSMRIPAWAAFDHVRGSQATVNRILGHLEAAAANGMQLRQALILIGGPGCGKSFLADAIKATLEGELVYVVDGCPVHENPINLLKLLSAEQLKALADELGMSDPDKVTLQALVHVAGEPCRHCYSQLMFDKDGKTPKKEPDLANVQVKVLRLSSRTFGISTWGQTEDGCSLIEAIKQGSGGIVDIPELAAVQVAQPGKTLQVEALVDATDARRVPDLSMCGEGGGGFLPINAFILGQTNQGSWDSLLANQKDPDKYTRRFAIRSVPYITARIEEQLAYSSFLEGMKDAPDFDPLALKLAATLAVLTRVKMVEGLTPIDKVRLMNGEAFVVKRYTKPSTGVYSPTSMSATPLTAKEIEEMMKKSAEIKDEKEREGMYGLTMSFMLGFISELAERAMHAPKHPAFPSCGPTVTGIGMIDQLRAKLAQYEQTSGLTDAQKKMVKNAMSEFLLKAETTSDVPGWLELEYRRLLREQILEVFSPDFERRAQEIFLKYRLHARAYGNALSKVKLPGLGITKEVDVDVSFLDKIDKGKGLKSNLSDVRAYRGSIDAQLNDLAYSHGTLPSEKADELKVDWTTLPELKQAIEDFLNSDIAKRVERLITVKYDLLTDDEKAEFDTAFAAFKKLGYNEVSLARALEYAKELKLWASAQA